MRDVMIIVKTSLLFAIPVALCMGVKVHDMIEQ